MTEIQGRTGSRAVTKRGANLRTRRPATTGMTTIMRIDFAIAGASTGI